ncbi:MAG: cation transporter [Hyphomicrobiaceae bacterium]|nr:cation transporter [Hyphomicrobiaceae bacterium]
MPQPADHDVRFAALRKTVATVAALNLGYFGVEAIVALAIGSVALFADSVDFLEDATVNLLVLVALGWSAARRRAVGVILAALLIMPGVAAAVTAAGKLMSAEPMVPEPMLLTLTGMGALAVNALAASLLARFRAHAGSLVRAAFLSARNDVIANVAIIGAGLATAATASIWPDLIVGLGILLLNLDAAREVYEAAMAEGDDDLAPRP